MNTEYIIFYDAYQEAMWFQALCPHLKDAKFEPINKSLNVEVNRLLRYDKPDIILTANSKAILSLEKTTEVPTGHNIGQRFGRIVCAAEEKVLGIYFGPFMARKHGQYTSKCWINIRQIEAMLKLKEFHSIPSLAINWKCNDDGELIRDGSETKELSVLITKFIESRFSVTIPEIQKVESLMRSEIKDGIKRHKSYAYPPNSAKIVPTKNFLADKRLKGYTFPEYFFKRPESLHYKVGMKAGLRSDPFTGMQLVYDYIYCRTGGQLSNRNRNLVLEIPDLTTVAWNAVTNTQRKDKKMLKMFPDLLILKDGYA